jgi:gamma-glutamyltranspeptidase/glutathione hydrolase
MPNQKLNPSSKMRRDFIQASGIAAISPLIPNFAYAQSTSKSALATSSKGMVTSPHELATEAGLKVLQSGGNAIEAVIAISSCLSVTYPHFSGFGGDAFMIISDANGKAQTISGIGQAPQDIGGYSGSIPFRGPKSMLTSAAYVDALGKAYEISKKDLQGKKSWSSLLTPAIKLAKDGFPVTESEVFWFNFRLKASSLNLFQNVKQLT